MSYWFILQSSGENGQTYQYYKSCIYMYDSWKLHVIGNNTGLVKYKLFGQLKYLSFELNSILM